MANGNRSRSCAQHTTADRFARADRSRRAAGSDRANGGRPERPAHRVARPSLSTRHWVPKEATCSDRESQKTGRLKLSREEEGASLFRAREAARRSVRATKGEIAAEDGAGVEAAIGARTALREAWRGKAQWEVGSSKLRAWWEPSGRFSARPRDDRRDLEPEFSRT